MGTICGCFVPGKAFMTQVQRLMSFIQCCIDLTIASLCFSFKHIKHMAVKRRCWWCPGAALGSSLHFIPVVCSFNHNCVCRSSERGAERRKDEYTVVCKHITYIIIHVACFCSVCLCECVWVNEGTESAVTCFLVQWQFGPLWFLSGCPESLPALAVDHTRGDSVKALLSAASPKAAM